MIFEEILKTSKKIHNGRTVLEVLCSVQEEVGELAKEIRIKYGKSYKKPDVDGVFGESIDIIAAVVDIMYVDNPDITEAEVLEHLKKKLHKWETKETEHQHFIDSKSI